MSLNKRGILKMSMKVAWAGLNRLRFHSRPIDKS